MLFGLANEGNASALFRRLNRGGTTPAVTLHSHSSTVVDLTYLPLLYAGGAVISAFTLITTITSLLFMLCGR